MEHLLVERFMEEESAHIDGLVVMEEESSHIDGSVVILNLDKSCDRKNFNIALTDLSTLNFIKKY